MQGALARTLALSGKTEMARTVLGVLTDLSSRRYVSPFEFLTIHFALGDLDEGYRWLTKACDDRSFELLAMNVDPRFDQLRTDPRFLVLLERVGVAAAAGGA
jgi:hypothetical protein